MAELDNKYSSRVIFKPGKQKEFIFKVQSRLAKNIDQISSLINVHPRTFRDWRREKFSMSLCAVKKFCRLTGLPMPQNTTIKDPFWYTNKGGRNGGIAIIKKYGRVPVDEEFRKRKWREWWKKVGRFQDHPIINKTLPFREPNKSKELAEFFGIMMGDGGLTPGQLCITLHHIDDLEYSHFVANLIKKLFCISPSIIHISTSSINRILVSRSELVNYLHSLGLVIGNKIKQQFDIPDWIKDNKTYLIACLRGLVDTDGCVFFSSYKVSGKMYKYKKLAFTTMSTPLRRTVFKAFQDLGMNPQISQQRDVRLNSIVDMKTYFKLINSHNPKHLNKYYN